PLQDGRGSLAASDRRAPRRWRRAVRGSIATGDGEQHIPFTSISGEVSAGEFVMAQITIDIDSEAKDAGAGATPATDIVRRCWAGVDASPLMLDYHDREWGVPLHGDRELFAKLVLDGFQARSEERRVGKECRYRV